MSYVKQLANELVLKKILCEIVSEGIYYARLYLKNRNDGFAYHCQYERMLGASDILASIIPGVSPFEVRRAFEEITEDAIDPAVGITERDIELVMEKIHQVSRRAINE